MQLPALRELRGERAQRVGSSWRRRLRFTSAAAHRLPSESSMMEAELLLPVGAAPAAVCLMLAATGEQGFARRRRFAAPLLSRGIAAVLLENPFYGVRRPRGQIGPVLRTVEDQFAMNLATVDEARALLAWLRREGFPRVGVTGFSQGGMMAAFAGALTDFPVACVPRCAGDRALPIFLDSALASSVDWRRLARDAGSESAARDQFARCLAPVCVSRHAPPLAPAGAVIVASRHDGFVPVAEARALHAHWAGSELRMFDTGHVTASLLDAEPHRQAIADALARLPPGC
ncbi:MAG: alpha/beta hydrolase family protein [Kofleriaceae bacterium]